MKYHFEARDIPALVYKSFHIKHESADTASEGSLLIDEWVTENEHLKMHINENGSLNLTPKATGHLFKKLHYFEDGGESGHPWLHISPQRDQIITTLNSRPEIECVESGPLVV